ncbi:hypothetical protein [Thermomonas flagellata]|uniref:hypothetical protein n=1 Tax=Thermomonas flagellata TaxID=2888524 RepID=UPI001F041DAD|nr:hypothetical protein [Thermomonas flagellata]
MARKTSVIVFLAMAGIGFTAVALAAGPATQEAASKPQEVTPKAGGSNRGYVVGDGGVARLKGSKASGQSAQIGINEPGVNRKAGREAPPRETAAPKPQPPRGD